MAQGNHFLTIPKHEGLFTTIKSGRAGETRDDSPVEDEDEEDIEEDVRFAPRCSPIPRKRGLSITDETAEYMRIRLDLQRRVSFADASGGELVDVREFATFDSGDEEDNPRWEEEEENCRRAYRQAHYRLCPEFQACEGSELALAVQANKVEVEKVTAVQGEPLSFDAMICVLNVSYHKCVYVRSTMDGWTTHSDTTAEYVQGSHDGNTDKFSVRLSFAEPYLFNGARIDFVVRYETSDGEFWANNSGRNYSVTLAVSYEEETGPVPEVDDREVKGILKPPRYRVEEDSDFSLDTNDGKEDNQERMPAAEISSFECPLVIEPEIDIENPEGLISSSKTREDSTIAEYAEGQGEHSLQDLPDNPLQTDHLEKVQVSELLIPTVSVQNESPDKNPTYHSERHFGHFDNSSQLFCPNQETPKSSPYFVAQPQDQITDKMDVDNTESLLQELQESKQETLRQRAVHDILIEESHEPLLENPEMQMMRHNTVVRRKNTGKEQASLRAGIIPGMIEYNMWQPSEPNNLGQTRDRTNQNILRHPKTPEPDITEHEPRDQEPEVPEVPLVNIDTPFGSEDTLSKEESPMITSFHEAKASVTEQAAAPEVVDGESSMTQGPFKNEEYEFFCDDTTSFQKQVSQPVPIEASNGKADMILGETLIPSFAFLSATLCLIVGFHEPSFFLIMALFLVSLCF